jgi:hypothetical protein
LPSTDRGASGNERAPPGGSWAPVSGPLWGWSVPVRQREQCRLDSLEIAAGAAHDRAPKSTESAVRPAGRDAERGQLGERDLVRRRREDAMTKAES